MHTELGDLLCDRLDLKFDGTCYYFHLTSCAERGENCRSYPLTELVSPPIFSHIFTKRTRFGLCCCWENSQVNKASVFLQ